ncbi:MAG TPA: outer membrane beta-barrel protein, partial [bacterium]|nr:outer membrane beta-barrel protein [bacterium]
ASYVSSNTPWFFTGLRVQFFPSDALKIEPWIINGWQTYNEFNNGFGNTGMNFGMEIRWAPSPDVVVISNNYSGYDEPDSPNCIRFHTDDSFLLKYLDDPKSGGIDKMAFSLTCDYGFMSGPMWIGNGAAGTGGTGQGGSYVNVGPTGPNQEEFVGAMFYDRTWFNHDTLAFTFGGGFMYNPGEYLALLPPINGDTGANYSNDPVANAAFTELPGSQWNAWDYDFGFQWMPNQYLTVDLEYTHRFSSLNYFVGPGGVTSSDGWQAGANTGSTNTANGYVPNLVQFEDLIIGSLMIHI